MIRYLKDKVLAFLNNRNIVLLHEYSALITHPYATIEYDIEYIIAHYLMNKEDLHFIQIGANDGKTYDPIHKFVKKYNWSGVLVEPQPEAYSHLTANYAGQSALIFVNSALSSDNEPRILYRTKYGCKELPTWSQGLATFDKSILLAHKELIPDIEAYIEEQIVPCVTFGDLLVMTGKRDVDLIQIDVEGYDYEIIKLIPFDTINPNIIHYEHKHLSLPDQEGALKYLIHRGYKVSVFANGNTVAYRSRG